MSTLKTNTLSNVAGTASTAIENAINGSAKAWVNFNGTGTVAIRASYNVSSITDGGTGTYTVNYTNALANVNYCAIGQRSRSVSVVNADFDEVFASRATSSSQWSNVEGGNLADTNNVSVTIFI
jgi:ApbE superfamily uncharacterized protein (UPF0280 family)